MADYPCLQHVPNVRVKKIKDHFPFKTKAKYAMTLTVCYVLYLPHFIVIQFNIITIKLIFMVSLHVCLLFIPSDVFPKRHLVYRWRRTGVGDGRTSAHSLSARLSHNLAFRLT
ncbi:hypothetical protein CEXT_760361 [Caerostris extrusa]|uniref:Uncharacterized protein n=1 Tax=Caerostris extrusa TaxID=172846 RepID=A0AAV4T9T8_CAEEX|nr:hypothetical protein CEXT_760361 [Caerostris extrusa]